MTSSDHAALLDRARALDSTALRLVDADLKDMAHHYFMRSHACHVAASFYSNYSDGDEYAT